MVFTPTDIGRLVTPGAPVLSPDGTRAAFTVTRTDVEANSYRSAVWLVRTDGSAPARQVTADNNDANPMGRNDGALSQSS
ncbi:hypothetical protein [Granulicoccus sp. GXG6511]|uniref:hypothetical protein n=1 Tax=Granulicoccus sp. GXG6511 TaxID=3381351 RepID=UPI003D7C9763